MAYDFITVLNSQHPQFLESNLEAHTVWYQKTFKNSLRGKAW